jgi:hypothetical protein
MSIARTLAWMLVAAATASVFMPAAYAEAPGSARSGAAAATGLTPIRLAELNQRNHGKQLAPRKHTKHRGKVHSARIAHHKDHRAYRVVRKQNVNSILLRLAPYDLTWA